MRNGVTLATLRDEVLIEAGFETDAGHAVYSKQRLTQMLNRMERYMQQIDDWPSTEFEEEVTVAPDAQFVNLPTNINFTMIDTVHVAFGDDWLPVYHGIGMQQRSIYNSTQRATPIMRWEIRAPGNVDFEVWPIGASQQTLRFSGSKKLGVMATDSDTCTLDADVLVLRVAAEILGRDQKDDASLKLKMAEELTNSILKRQGSAKQTNISLIGREATRLRPGIDYIPPGSGM